MALTASNSHHSSGGGGGGFMMNGPGHFLEPKFPPVEEYSQGNYINGHHHGNNNTSHQHHHHGPQDEGDFYGGRHASLPANGLPASAHGYGYIAGQMDHHLQTLHQQRNRGGGSSVAYGQDFGGGGSGQQQPPQQYGTCAGTPPSLTRAQEAPSPPTAHGFPPTAQGSPTMPSPTGNRENSAPGAGGGQGNGGSASSAPMIYPWMKKNHINSGEKSL